MTEGICTYLLRTWLPEGSSVGFALPQFAAPCPACLGEGSAPACKHSVHTVGTRRTDQAKGRCACTAAEKEKYALWPLASISTVYADIRDLRKTCMPTTHVV